MPTLMLMNDETLVSHRTAFSEHRIGSKTIREEIFFGTSHILNGILNSISNTELNGHKTQRLANTSNITFHGIESEALLILLAKEDQCVVWSACHADAGVPCHVLGALKARADSNP
jgi:cysteine sulfinate desulfinase/cysteine desulfurase-like protein